MHDTVNLFAPRNYAGYSPILIFSPPDRLSNKLFLIWLLTIPPHLGWRRGAVVSGVRRMNEVNARRARLLPGWVTVFGRVYHLGV